MTAVPDGPTAVTPAALSAFLRGVERRGIVLAQLQSGDDDAAERALAAALRAFHRHAAESPMAAWPGRFWTLLAATPPLRQPTANGAWLPPFTALGRLPAGDRLALLLRIVAGLDENDAAETLAMTGDGYRQALARACPRDAQGHPDAAAWRALAEAAQQEVRELSPLRAARLAQLRESAIAAATPAPVAAPPRRPSAATRPAAASATAEAKPPARRWRPAWPRWRPRAPRWDRRWAGALLAVAVIAVLSVWWSRRPPALPPEPVSQAPAGVLHVTDAAPVLVEELPDADLPPPTAVPAVDPRDRAMLSDPDLELARDADFLAWYAAGHPLPVDESGAHAAPVTPSPHGPETLDDEN